ncbi:MAG TPA: uridine kinase [Candidatus Sumerlaeota bacterium]|nr:uridine kinase [Candidatus Sumerlaeota bacterium]HMX63709.1 uridine kinase [Candidatus Sumerlaeota bacterium]HMZ52250.1 uridine kinase [Candidatus Sumerlaeota bacterium]HNM46215.1 uridine kinase [Candidatus Sumerlaeota bacterium]
MNSVVIGIAGGSGSGKTTFAQSLMKQLRSEHVVMLGLDNYYLDHSELPLEERAKINYDHPDAFDWDLLLAHVKALRAGKAIESPIYNYAVHGRMKETTPIKPGKVIIVEGILVLYDKRLIQQMDIKIFVDAEADVRFIRRLQRDIEERGRSLNSVVDQYLNVVRKMHLGFVEPSKRHADIIIPKGGHNEIAIDMILTKIRSILSDGHHT